MKEKKKKEMIKGKINRPKEWPAEPSGATGLPRILKPREVIKPDQPNLFGDQDRVYNVLQTRVTELNAEISRCQEAIEKKEDAITVLMGDLGETQRAVEIVRKQRKALKSKEVPKNPKKKKGERSGKSINSNGEK